MGGVSAAAAAAAAAAACGVAAAWNAVAAVQASSVAAAAARVASPLVRAGREGRAPSTAERRRLALVASAVVGAGGFILGGPALGALLAAAAPWAVLAAARARRARYRDAAQRGAAAVARALADALAGGAALRGAAVAAAAGGVPGPAGRELGACAAAITLGAPTDAALEGLRLRAGGGAYDAIVAAALLQRDAGGDLAGLLRGVAASLDEAARLEGDARAATAQARFTGLLVGALPIGAAALAELASPGYLASLAASPVSLWLAACAAGLQVTAIVAIRRLGRMPA